MGEIKTLIDTGPGLVTEKTLQTLPIELNVTVRDWTPDIERQLMFYAREHLNRLLRDVFIRGLAQTSIRVTKTTMPDGLLWFNFRCDYAHVNDEHRAGEVYLVQEER